MAFASAVGWGEQAPELLLLDAVVELELAAVVELELAVVVELELDVVLDEDGAPPVLLLDVVTGDPVLLEPVVAWLEDPPFPFEPPPPQAIGPDATPTTAATIPRPFTPSFIISKTSSCVRGQLGDSL
jgi:hypothetical protein